MGTRSNGNRGVARAPRNRNPREAEYRPLPSSNVTPAPNRLQTRKPRWRPALRSSSRALGHAGRGANRLRIGKWHLPRSTDTGQAMIVKTFFYTETFSIQSYEKAS